MNSRKVKEIVKFSIHKKYCVVLEKNHIIRELIK